MTISPLLMAVPSFVVVKMVPLPPFRVIVPLLSLMTVPPFAVMPTALLPFMLICPELMAVAPSPAIMPVLPLPPTIAPVPLSTPMLIVPKFSALPLVVCIPTELLPYRLIVPPATLVISPSPSSNRPNALSERILIRP